LHLGVKWLSGTAATGVRRPTRRRFEEADRGRNAPSLDIHCAAS
jgi:hypothetical protein